MVGRRKMRLVMRVSVLSRLLTRFVDYTVWICIVLRMSLWLRRVVPRCKGVVE